MKSQKKILVILGLLMLNGCNKVDTASDFMKDDALRRRILTQCLQQHEQQDKNCQNASEAQKKIEFAKQTGKAEIN